MTSIACRIGSSIIRRGGHAPKLTRFMSSQTFKNVLVERVGEKKNVGLITLDMPKSLNALCNPLVTDIHHAAESLNEEKEIGCLILTGAGKAFSAGADIKQMQPMKFQECIGGKFLADWGKLGSKPVIAAVNGFALGGGCELAMMCDIIYAADKAQFGQPEILFGTIPGIGGAQRLTRYVGKSLAMELILTGDRISAKTALAAGLVSKVFESDKLLEETIKTAEKISGNSKLTVLLAKEAVNAAYETTLS